MAKKHIGFKAFAFAFMVSLAALGLLSAGIMAAISLTSPAEESQQSVVGPPGYQPRAEDSMTILFMGSRDDTVPPDRYMLMRFYPAERVLRLVPIPRELEATVNIKTGTLPELYDYGGVQMVCDAVRNVFSIKVDRYVKYNSEEFIDLVDLFGGVETNVEQTTEYTSEKGSTVRLVEGLQLLNGKKLLEYLSSPLVAGLEENEALKRRAELLASGIEQRLVDSIASRADALFASFVDLVQTNITNYDYTVRKEATGYIAQSEQDKAVYRLIDGSYTGTKDEKRFTPSPEGKEVMQSWFEPYGD
ncbi:MAG: LCP family protein [Oscillospiraceae bacterium]|jgi:LCP family protein required for cell wall assembly